MFTHLGGIRCRGILSQYYYPIMADSSRIPSLKRRKVHTDPEGVEDIPSASSPAASKCSVSAVDFLRETAHRRRKVELETLTRDVSPPPLRRATPSSSRATPAFDGVTPISTTLQLPSDHTSSIIELSTPPPDESSTNVAFIEARGEPDIHVPFKLTHIPALPTNHTVTLRALLQPPTPASRLTTVWCFNYLHSLPFLVNNLPSSTDLSALRIHLVHGSWKTQDTHRVRLENNRLAHPYPGNVRLVPAFMPEPFGTHHSKILILFSVEEGGGAETARVIIHTANMIPFDWGNMTQGVWDSGWLPLLPVDGQISEAPIGAEFKKELLRYLKAYGSARTGELTTELSRFNFSSVRAAFLASVPGRYKISECHFGWPGLQRILRNVQCPDSTSKVMMQLSSIATLANGTKDSWLTPIFLKALSTTAPIKPTPPKPEFSLIFPTPDEIRVSLNGYESGGAIHLKAISIANLKQIDYMRPYLCRWSASLAPPSTGGVPGPIRLAGRARAAPHIKTYIRFNEQACQTISWALLTSANLSYQAWGSAPAASKGGGLEIPGPEDEREIRICSYEAGVLVYPELFTEEGKEVVMKPLLHEDKLGDREDAKVKVGIRIPYDLPLVKYKPREMPWSPGRSYAELDCLGQSYTV